MHKLSAIILCCSLAATQCFADDESETKINIDARPQQTITPETKKASHVNSGEAVCYGGRNCTGRVLNHRDKHNCKNTGGKSWRRAPGSACEPT